MNVARFFILLIFRVFLATVYNIKYYVEVDEKKNNFIIPMCNLGISNLRESGVRHEIKQQLNWMDGALYVFFVVD